MHPDVHTRRHLLMRELSDLGWDRSLTSVVALALYPIDDHYEAVPDYESSVNKLAAPLAKRVKKARRGKGPVTEIRNEADIALRTYKELARSMGDHYYATRYDAALGLQAH